MLSFVNLWDVHETVIGIIVSITISFILNKIWTFEDKNFDSKRTLIQYVKFVLFSSIGALFQLGMVYYFVEINNMFFMFALIMGNVIAKFCNFILNKRWTFKEKIWS